MYSAEGTFAYLIFDTGGVADTCPAPLHNAAAGHAGTQARLLALEVHLMVLCDLFQRLEVL